MDKFDCSMCAKKHYDKTCNDNECPGSLFNEKYFTNMQLTDLTYIGTLFETKPIFKEVYEQVISHLLDQKLSKEEIILAFELGIEEAERRIEYKEKG